MKIVNIFGLVVAVHVVVLLMIFAIPGCRTTAPSAEADPVVMAPVDQPATTPSPIQRAPAMSASDLNPPLANSNYSAEPSIISPVGSGNRVSPTRPGSAAPTPSPIQPVDQPAATRTYKVVRGDSLWAIAKRHDTTVGELARANQLSANASLKIGQDLVIPATAAPAPAATPAGRAASADASTYTIRAGDTLGAIARRHGTSVAALKAMNNLRSDLVRVGDTLLIPEAGAPTSTPPTTPAATPTPATPAPTPAANNNLARGANGSMKHVVAPGETLGAIARKYGVKLGDLALANNIADPTRIRPGQELVVPGWEAPAGTAPASVPTQYPSSFQPEPAPADTPTIQTEPADDDVPVIQVEEPVQTLSVEPASGGGGSGSEPPLFN